MFDPGADRVGLEGFVTSDGEVVPGRLAGRSPGTFIWRLSRQNGGLALSYPDGSVRICIDKASPRGFSSIEDIVALWPHVYTVSLLELEAAEQAGTAGAGALLYTAHGLDAPESPAHSQTQASATAPDDVSRYKMVRQSVESSSCFDGSATREEIEARLAHHAAGTYVVRYSSSVPGDYTISLANSNGTITHSRLSCLASGFLLYDGHRYQSLAEFLSSKTEAGVLSQSLMTLERTEASFGSGLTAAGLHTTPTRSVCEPVLPHVASPIASPVASLRTSFASAILRASDESDGGSPAAPVPSGRITPPHVAPTPSFMAPLPNPASLPPLTVPPASFVDVRPDGRPLGSPSIAPTAQAPAPSIPAPAKAAAKMPAPIAADEDANLCVVCMDNRIDVILLECGHVCACSECADSLDECPMCRANIVRAVKMFFAH
ncbi:uncharacterized protein AMSG_06724 [Thecamonas trahens ATCC 50062]|uniref:RING-type domain-containing protein n=1 Tax=Thecamonas trahens ATCC 50062 TaxID=461836 RepID=A0A0L0DF17_THETB|nr:hypothetical protein AMSG_06724 [Thecamonas trahens ATCC 50062]KNC50820.1 hypothetical protein AMSG_06724 [Thecamonas trahens ATCC 50062]|eukprot:XP_013756775.1 hypothetical protein AMSG_06724 [Thecamonas trahens ATCC 50062]